MSIKLFLLKDVPEDEANAIRDLLDAESIEYYETSAGNWGVSMAAIWLNDESRFTEARAIIDQYQLQRQTEFRQMSQQKNAGFIRLLVRDVMHNPLRFLFFTGVSVTILYLSISPFLI